MDNRFSNRLFDFYRNNYVTMEQICADMLVEEELTMVQLRLLLILHATGDIPVGQLSQRAAMNSGNCSSMCKKMEKMELLVRRKEQSDERVVTIGLSEEGKRKAGRILDYIDGLHDQICTTMLPEEINELVLSIKKLDEYMNRLRDVRESQI